MLDKQRIKDAASTKGLLMKPTIVLVHGAFAESASWDGVIDSLMNSGHPVIAAANPLRDLATDAASIGDVIRTIEGPVVLVAPMVEPSSRTCRHAAELVAPNHLNMWQVGD
jgi:pimeloyl-ACP methyl ester carboxylesterase